MWDTPVLMRLLVQSIHYEKVYLILGIFEGTT